MEIFIVSPDGKRLKRLTENGVYDDYPSWSPDSQLIAFVSQRNVGFRDQIHLMTADGEYLKQLSDLHLEKDADPDWFNPSGRTVAPRSEKITIWGRIKKLASNLR